MVGYNPETKSINLDDQPLGPGSKTSAIWNAKLADSFYQLQPNYKESSNRSVILMDMITFSCTHNPWLKPSFL